MIIRLFNISKRENSTLRPSGTGTEFNCVLKADTSIINPVILIDFADQSNPQMHRFNYAYIPDFARYYFISDIQSSRGLIWEYTLTCDILATYRDQIAGSTLYLTRCSSQYDGAVMDNYYPVKTTYSVVVRTVTTPWIHDGTENPDVSQGCFILGIISKPGNLLTGQFGSIRYVALTRSNLITLVDYLMTAGTLTSDVGISIDGLNAEAVKAVIDPLQFIKSCIWTPILYESVSGSEQTGLPIWSITASGVSFKYVPNNPPYIVTTASFANVPAHPLAASRGSYLNCAPYTKMIASIPPFGLVELDTTLAAPAATIIGMIIYDLITGTAILQIHYGTASGAPACRIKSQVGVPIQLTQVYNDYISAAGGVVGGLAGGIASALTGNIAGAITGGVAAIGSAIDAMRPVVSSMGGNGGFSDLRGQARLYSIFYDVPDEDRAHVGRPLCQNVTMDNVASGSYCLAMDGDIAITGTNAEQQRLKEYLEGGFYYE